MRAQPRPPRDLPRSLPPHLETLRANLMTMVDEVRNEELGWVEDEKRTETTTVRTARSRGTRQVVTWNDMIQFHHGVELWVGDEWARSSPPSSPVQVPAEVPIATPMALSSPPPDSSPVSLPAASGSPGRVPALSMPMWWYEYLASAGPVLDELKRRLSVPTRVSFGLPSPPPRPACQLLDVGSRYMDIVRRWFPVSMYRPERKPKHGRMCSRCRCPAVPTRVGSCSDFMGVMCGQCGRVYAGYSMATSYRDAERISLTPKFKYCKGIHFRDSLSQLQGKQTKTIRPEVFEDLQTKFRKHGLVDESAKTFHDRHRRVTKDHILWFLSETGHSKHYKDANLLLRFFTGNPCADIPALEPVLIADFEKVVTVFKKLDTGRINILNGQYVLYQLLRIHNLPVREKDFELLRTIDRLADHDHVWELICAELRWPFYPLF